jgi:hypothetical protein
MDVDRFTQDRTAGWEELAQLVRAAGSRPQNLGSEALLLLGFDRRVLPIRAALRRVGTLIRALEEEGDRE